MTQEDVEAVRDFYAAVNEGEAERSNSFWAADVELELPSQVGLLAGRVKGREPVIRWFEDWFSSFQDVRFEISEVAQLDNGRVLLIAEQHARGRSSGLEMRGTVAWLYTVRGGLIARAELFLSREEAIARAQKSDAPGDTA